MDTLLNNLLNNNLMIFVAGAVGGLLGLAFSYSELGKIIRMIRTSTSEIGMLPLDEQQVEIVGKADSGTTVTSPITKQPCVLWQVEVLEKQGSGKRSRWVTVYSNTSTPSFDVYDGTGKVQIFPNRLTELILRDDVRKSSGIFNALDEQIQTALKDLGVDTKGSIFNKTMRVHERYIEPGDQIYVLGKTFYKNGIKMMDGESSQLIVSDQSELRVLGRFFWRVVINALLGAVIGIALFLYFTNR